MTVTGTTRLSASQTWVMPSFLPRIPLFAIAFSQVVSTAHGPVGPSGAPGRPGARRGRAPGRSGAHLVVPVLVLRGATWLPSRGAAGLSVTECGEFGWGRGALGAPGHGVGRSSSGRRRRCRRTNVAQRPRSTPPDGPARNGRPRSHLLDLDLDVDAGGQVEALEGVDRLRRRARRCRAGACGSASRSARGESLSLWGDRITQ